MFYLSSYLEAHRDEYYQRLQNISREGDWNGWIAFFLKAITAQAGQNNTKVKAIMGLYDEMKSQIHEITHSQYVVHLLDAIFFRPIFETTDFIKRTGIRKKTAMALLKQLRDSHILTTLRDGSGRRAAVLCFPRLIHITEGKKFG
jgi:Fic family protein